MICSFLRHSRSLTHLEKDGNLQQQERDKQNTGKNESNRENQQPYI
jgi:hypothetical protein